MNPRAPRFAWKEIRYWRRNRPADSLGPHWFEIAPFVCAILLVVLLAIAFWVSAMPS